MKSCTLKNEQLVAQIQTGGDRSGEIILMLWNQNQGIVQQFVKKYQGMAEYEDLCQEAFIALCSAVNNYRGDMGSFINYLCFWLRHRLHRYCENNASLAHVPIGRYELIRKIQKASAEFEQKFFREPTRRELSEMLGVSWSDIDCARLADIVKSSTSLDKSIDADGESCTLLEFLPCDADPAADAIDRELQREMKEALSMELGRLPEDQQKAISLVYLEGMSRNKAGHIMNLTHNQVCVLIDRGFRKLRRRPERLKPFICDQALAIAYKGTVISFKNTRTSATERAAFRDMRETSCADI